jgi:uncharacterized membrane protein YciS (DUF1049 family)
MRLFLLVLLVFAIPLIAFLLLNGEELVTVNLGTAAYSDVRLSTVVLICVAIGAGLVGVIAVIEGAAIRLANHRLRRESRRLESELNLVRTEAPSVNGPPASKPTAEPIPLARTPEDEQPIVASAPVYSEDEFDAYREPD